MFEEREKIATTSSLNATNSTPRAAENIIHEAPNLTNIAYSTTNNVMSISFLQAMVVGWLLILLIVLSYPDASKVIFFCLFTAVLIFTTENADAVLEQALLDQKLLIK